MAFCLHSCTWIPFWKRIYFIRKDFAPKWQLVSACYSNKRHVAILFHNEQDELLTLVTCLLGRHELLTPNPPSVYEQFAEGNHVVSRYRQAFGLDRYGLGAISKLGYKKHGGLTDVSKQQGTVERWFLRSHERAAITTVLKIMCDLDDSEGALVHKDTSSTRIKKDEEDDGIILFVFHFAVGVVAPKQHRILAKG